MKALLPLLLLLSAATIAHAQSDGFLGIKWGSTPERVIAVMMEVEGVVPGERTDSTIDFSGGTYMGVSGPKYGFTFSGGRLVSTVVALEIPDPDAGDVAYSRIVRGLSKQYGLMEPSPYLIERAGRAEHTVRTKRTSVSASMYQIGSERNIAVVCVGTMPSERSPRTKSRAR